MIKKTCILTLAVLMAGMGLTSCGATQTKLDTPTNLTYDKSTGEFSFDAVKGASTYVLGVSKIINDDTGKGIAAIKGSNLITLDEDKTEYVWTSQTGSVSGLADDDGDGKISGKVVYRSFSSSATDAGSVITPDKLPLGHYVVMVMADPTDKLEGSDYALSEFYVGGTLITPDGFTAAIGTDNKVAITAPSGFYLSGLTDTSGDQKDGTRYGLPKNMAFTVKEGTTVVEEISLADFSYTNQVNGPSKSFSFVNNTVYGTKTLDSSKKYEVSVQSIGEGDVKSSAVAKAYMATSTEAVTYTTKYDCSGSGTASPFTVNLNVGVDESGNKIYGLEAKVSSTVIYRENGSYAVSDDAVVGVTDNKNTFPADTVLTFTSVSSDLDTSVMNGKTLKVTKIESQGWGGVSINYGLLGTGFSLNGTSFDFTGVVSSGFFPGGPM